ncbi:hypothetical protein PGSY75_1448100 [Plasmodium gaboni]|uniref:Uncharacterized protein n=1 Tax=Plasmodium gaboni TaxID=647221 RepID=A0A151LAT8_9APIC|nr:hypothetical protein PGSY75_1448100 [Plasmodium gaboni]KYN96072.1 hypothetical protein PGSY75_1448100 [Plasmodium gaboni]SOV19373.1 conserved Plasmodium protein, unknown function [Plasmodium gaboni]SOV25201.1 conserved Plasmodium protein, unknown function [Plasmodium sp. DRC-Itaito]
MKRKKSQKKTKETDNNIGDKKEIVIDEEGDEISFLNNKGNEYICNALNENTINKELNNDEIFEELNDRIYNKLNENINYDLLEDEIFKELNEKIYEEIKENIKNDDKKYKEDILNDNIFKELNRDNPEDLTTNEENKNINDNIIPFLLKKKLYEKNIAQIEQQIQNDKLNKMMKTKEIILDMLTIIKNRKLNIL